MKVNFKSIFAIIFLIVAVVVGVTFITDSFKDENEPVYSDILQYFDDDRVTTFVIDGNLNIQLHVIRLERDANGNEIAGKYVADSNGNFITDVIDYQLSDSSQRDEIYEIARNKMLLKAEGVHTNLVEYNATRPEGTPWYLAYLPYIIVAVLFIGLWFFIMKQAPGGGKMNSFSKSKAKLAVGEKDAVKFIDVAGADEEKAELEEVVEFLKDPAKFVKLGARIPRGVLLVGPPGTGKTLLAKAVAGEAGVPFFSISGSDFVEMYVGVGASRVRDLFDNARKHPASIIFIDEIDAVGRHRGAGLGGGHDEREQTLNQLLVEMDGFGTNSGVIVMAATNRPDILDPALLRPGRFDRRVTVNYPDIKGREAILKVHCRNKPLEESVDLKKIAQTTIGFTGAELANLMNEAALNAAKKNKALIGMVDIEESYMKLLLGPQKKSNVRTEKDNKLCAYHEAGHAVASYFCKNTDPVKHITIIPAGNAGGVTISVPTEDRMCSSRNQMLDVIVRALGGRVAEEIVLDDISTGASNDIQQATSIARNMVTRYGMSAKLGTVLYGSEHSSDEVFLGRDFSSGKNYSEKTAAEIDDEIREIIATCYKTCATYLKDNIEKLHFVAEFLLKNESMDDEQFKAAMEMENPTIEDIVAIAAEKKRKSEEENKAAHIRNKKAAEEEAAKAAEEAKRRLEEKDNATGFPVDDFFGNVFTVPKDADCAKGDIGDGESEDIAADKDESPFYTKDAEEGSDESCESNSESDSDSESKK